MSTAIFFISRPARDLMNEFAGTAWSTAFALENALLDHKPEMVRNHLLAANARGNRQITAVAKVLKEQAHSFDLRAVNETFTLLCTAYLVQDYTLIDLRKITDICIHFPLSVVEVVVKRCRAQGIFTLAYLGSALTSEAGSEIDDLRREARLDKIAYRSKPMPLPTEPVDPGPLARFDPAATRKRLDLERHYADLARKLDDE